MRGRSLFRLRWAVGTVRREQPQHAPRSGKRLALLVCGLLAGAVLGDAARVAAQTSILEYMPRSPLSTAYRDVAALIIAETGVTNPAGAAHV